MATNTFKNAGVAVGTSDTTLYTCPASTQAVVHALYCANIDGINSVNVSISWTDNSASTTYKIAHNIPVPAGSTLTWDKPINLEAADVLKITASATGDVEATASILEIV